MNADNDHSRSSRRPRPEVAVYRPGSGPLKKSSSNVENIQPSSSSQGTHRTEVEGGLATTFRNVRISDESNKSKEKTGETQIQEPKPRRTNNQRHDRNATKPQAEAPQHQNSIEKKEEMRDQSFTSRQGKRQPQCPEKSESGSSQDLRQLLIEKRLQRNTESPSASQHSESLPSTSQPSNGRQRNDNRQSTKPREEFKNGHHRSPIPSNNGPQSLPIESSSNFTRQGDKRNSVRRRNDRKPRIENSHSEGHLVALTNNNSPATTTHQPSKDFEGEKQMKTNDFDKGRNGKERKEGNLFIWKIW